MTGRPAVYSFAALKSRDLHRPVIFNSVPIGFTNIE